MKTKKQNKTKKKCSIKPEESVKYIQQVCRLTYLQGVYNAFSCRWCTVNKNSGQNTQNDNGNFQWQFSAPSIADQALLLLRSMEVLLKRLMKVCLDNYRMLWEMLTKSEHCIEKVSSIETITWKSWWSCIKYRHMPKDCANHICSYLDLTIIKNWCLQRNTAVQPYLNLLIS